MTLSICRFGDPTPLGAQKGGVTKTADVFENFRVQPMGNRNTSHISRFAVPSDLVVTTACAIRRLSCLFDCGLSSAAISPPSPPLAPCWQAMDKSVAGVLTVGGTKTVFRA